MRGKFLAYMTLTALSYQSTSVVKIPVGSGLASTAAPGGELYQPVDIHQALEEVRRMPEFQPPQPSWLDELWKQPWVKQIGQTLEKVFQQFSQVLKGLFSHFNAFNFSHLPDSIRDIFSGFVGFLLVLACLFALYTVLGWLVRLKEKKTNDAQAPPRLLERELLINSEHHYRQARLHAEKQEYDAGLQQLYMATLCLLDERKIAPFEATRTNAEYAALLGKTQLLLNESGNEALKRYFIRMARQFESMRYGLRSTSPGQFETSCTDYQELQSLVSGLSHG